ncbi:hypothetical protein [Hyalangium versicolor]|uniref:hypothetical protein n=1 Tax=Hyalangium versicolor TaxID=2861190 RepID=UPI001CCC55A0|nr:hypothetical protein [Hyalangium versicolor]
MKKAAAAMVAAFMTGGATMAVLGSVLGPLSEAAVLGIVGASLYAGSAVLQGKLAAPPESLAKQA